MLSTIIKPAVVLVAGIVYLASPPRAEAAAFLGCNQSFPADCENKSINDIRLICDVVCEAWTFAICAQNGDLTCFDHET